ncbi:MAG: type II toxin-antitoxin system PemK/MazF family toxin [Cyanobacteria bacterium P01_D01_bin.44]
MTLAKGNIVLVPFPFTDLSQTKLRPAIILWVAPNGNNITLCFISSQNLNRLTDDEFLIEAEAPEFAQTGLKVASKARVSRLVTLESRLLRRRLGNLGPDLMQRLDHTLIHTFQLAP